MCENSTKIQKFYHLTNSVFHFIFCALYPELDSKTFSFTCIVVAKKINVYMSEMTLFKSQVTNSHNMVYDYHNFKQCSMINIRG